MKRPNWSEGSSDSPASSDELFSRGTLELTFSVLRKPYPALALAIQNALAQAYPRHDYQTGLHSSELPLSSDTIDRIALALAVLSRRCATGSTQHGSTPCDLALLRSLLLDWMMLARSRDNDSDEFDGPANSA
ncbi:MAG: hypothetical protein RBS88_01880 [Spongiibacteraceae bacterium]|jgi:hypothetical protein|nr:hypothetical protein [Spongiibacteraceae bacterium]